MITKHDLQAAIAECQGERNPSVSTCIKLAAFYTVMNELYPDEPARLENKSYSYSSGAYEGGSEFAQLVNGKDQREVYAVIDELMETIQVLNPRLYASVLRKLQ